MTRAHTLVADAVSHGLTVIPEENRTLVRKNATDSVVVYPNGSIARMGIHLAYAVISVDEARQFLGLGYEVSHRRNKAGFKDSADMFRNGGERICFCDGYDLENTKRIVEAIRASGFKAWRTGETVWVRADDVAKIDVDVDAIINS